MLTLASPDPAAGSLVVGAAGAAVDVSRTGGHPSMLLPEISVTGHGAGHHSSLSPVASSTETIGSMLPALVHRLPSRK